MSDFFAILDELAASSAVAVDRRRAQPHPHFPGVTYPLDYGHLANTRAVDGAEVDVFIGSASGRGVVGVLLTADRQKRDVELKVLLDCTPEEAELARRFCAEVLKIGGHLVERGASAPGRTN
ncbi:inorganic pyrophosphatase [Saccharopolyspora sp. K220]|uniref:inorganic pyrophosphatase n=1 Tax=Saccharopolyspora soli TaxID=2926618 RepID=UPI001F57332E|nr:inorganic pyrophosphatase [Saccharopolyspora soli]MCI2418934.1 inorganic pyrophosphatase [Saccharopolyspora soli]